MIEQIVQNLEMQERINNPDFISASRIHDWRNYIPEQIIQMWEELSDEAKAIAVICAEVQADGEE